MSEQSGFDLKQFADFSPAPSIRDYMSLYDYDTIALNCSKTRMEIAQHYQFTACIPNPMYAVGPNEVQVIVHDLAESYQVREKLRKVGFNIFSTHYRIIDHEDGALVMDAQMKPTFHSLPR